MSALTIINAVLADIEEVTAIVDNRIFPVEAEQMQEKPYLVTNIISAKDESLISSAGRYPRHRVSIDCIAKKATLSNKLADIIFDRLPDVIKATVGDFKDVDIMFADVDFTQPDKNGTARMRTLHFFVRWRRDGDLP